MKLRFATAALLYLTLPAFGQGVDPLIGSWKLNVEKTTSDLPLPKSQTDTFAGEGQNFTNTAAGVDAQGRAYKIVFQHIYDGQPHPTTANLNYDSSTYTRIGNTINTVRFRNGKVAEIGQVVIIPGKTYAFSAEGIDANNRPYHSFMVFDRQ
jgi:hypothetical protein